MRLRERNQCFLRVSFNQENTMKKILILEDDRVAIEHMMHAFRNAGHEVLAVFANSNELLVPDSVVSAINRDEVLQLAKGFVPDIALLDHKIGRASCRERVYVLV